jgi:hypothetical protein
MMPVNMSWWAGLLVIGLLVIGLLVIGLLVISSLKFYLTIKT